VVTEERRECGICKGLMQARKVDAALPLLPVVYECPVCDRRPTRKVTR